MEMDEVLTAEEMAGHLSVKPETITRWARQGLIPVCRLTTKTLRFDVKQVMAALRATGSGPDSPASSRKPPPARRSRA